MNGSRTSLHRRRLPNIEFFGAQSGPFSRAVCSDVSNSIPKSSAKAAESCGGRTSVARDQNLSPKGRKGIRGGNVKRVSI